MHDRRLVSRGRPSLRKIWFIRSLSCKSRFRRGSSQTRSQGFMATPFGRMQATRHTRWDQNRRVFMFLHTGPSDEIGDRNEVAGASRVLSSCVSRNGRSPQVTQIIVAGSIRAANPSVGAIRHTAKVSVRTSLSFAIFGQIKRTLATLWQ
jgi:hypothetical protein